MCQCSEAFELGSRKQGRLLFGLYLFLGAIIGGVLGLLFEVADIGNLIVFTSYDLGERIKINENGFHQFNINDE